MNRGQLSSQSQLRLAISIELKFYLAKSNAPFCDKQKPKM